MRDTNTKRTPTSVPLQSQNTMGNDLNRRWYFLTLALILAGIPFHQPLLVVCGILLLLVLGTTDIWAKYCFYDLRYQRQLSEKQATFGEEITLSLTIENAKLLPLPWLEVQDILPRDLSIQGQKIQNTLRSNLPTLECLFSPSWYERVTRRYTVQCAVRGIHTFGPTLLRSGDVFGFITREVHLTNYQHVLVYPLVVPLASFGLSARHPFGERRAPRRLLEDPSRAIGVRDYAYGDSLRRINWKATARTTQLQSKVYEATTTYTVVIFLNVVARLDAYYGIHPALQELSICAAASITNWAIDQGYAVGLYANTIMSLPDEEILPTTDGVDPPNLETKLSAEVQRRRIRLPASSSAEQRKQIMEALARTQTYFGTNIENVIQAERPRLPSGATVVVITESISEYLVETLIHMRQGGYSVAILFVGDTPPPIKLAGITVHHLGGDTTWQQLVATYGKNDVKPTIGGSSGFRL